MFELRPYQKDAKQAVLEAWEEFMKVLLVLPTGTGKTIVFSRITQHLMGEGACVLILAERDIVLSQAQSKLYECSGLQGQIEKASERAEPDLFCSIVIGSVKTMMRPKRLERWPADTFTHIIVDECHHALSDSYQAILQHFNTAKVLGVTATADRGDKRDLGEYFEALAYEYSLKDAINDGFLSKITAQTIPIKIDLQGVKVTAGDFNEKALGHALLPYLSVIADHVPKDRKTLAFLPLIATSESFANMLRERGHDARHVCGVSKDRKPLLAWYATPGPKVMCNSMLLTEGFDQPDIGCILPLRATKIRSFFSQMIGRGTRPSELDLLILDFLWQTAKHNLVHPVNLVCDNPEVAEIAVKMQEAAHVPTDLFEIKATATRERENALAKKLKAQARKKYQSVDPLAFALSLHDDALMDYEPQWGWEKKKPSKGQITLIEKFGFDGEEITSKGFASALIDRLIKRAEANLCRPKQVRILLRLGHPDPSGLTFDRANAIINKSSLNDWRLDPADYMEVMENVSVC